MSRRREKTSKRVTSGVDETIDKLTGYSDEERAKIKAIFRECAEGSRSFSKPRSALPRLLELATESSFKTELRNIKFYFESASMSISHLIEFIERIERYEKEQKTTDERSETLQG